MITRDAKLRDKTDILMYETDTVLHPSVYIGYYLPWMTKVKSSVRFKIVNWLFGPGENSVIFYLDTDPVIAMERIRKRNTTFDRHENIADLRILKMQLDEVVEVALKSGVEVVKINTNGKSLQSVCQEMEQVLAKTFSLTLALLPEVGEPGAVI